MKKTSRLLFGLLTSVAVTTAPNLLLAKTKQNSEQDKSKNTNKGEVDPSAVKQKPTTQARQGQVTGKNLDKSKSSKNNDGLVADSKKTVKPEKVTKVESVEKLVNKASKTKKSDDADKIVKKSNNKDKSDSIEVVAKLDETIEVKQQEKSEKTDAKTRIAAKVKSDTGEKSENKSKSQEKREESAGNKLANDAKKATEKRVDEAKNADVSDKISQPTVKEERLAVSKEKATKDSTRAKVVKNNSKKKIEVAKTVDTDERQNKLNELVRKEKLASNQDVDKDDAKSIADVTVKEGSTAKVTANSAKTKIAKVVKQRHKKPIVLAQTNNKQEDEAKMKLSEQEAEKLALEKIKAEEKAAELAILRELQAKERAEQLAIAKVEKAKKAQALAERKAERKAERIKAIALAREARQAKIIAAREERRRLVAKRKTERDALLAMYSNNDEQDQGDAYPIVRGENFDAVQSRLIQSVRGQPAVNEAANASASSIVVQSGWDERLIKQVREQQAKALAAAQSGSISGAITTASTQSNANTSTRYVPVVRAASPVVAANVTRATTTTSGVVVQSGWDDRLISQIREQQRKAQQTAQTSQPVYRAAPVVASGTVVATNAAYPAMADPFKPVVVRGPVATGESVRYASSTVAKPASTDARYNFTPSQSSGDWGLQSPESWLDLRASSAMVVDQQTGKILFQKNANMQQPIASISKLMTALVTLDAGLPMDEIIEVSDSDRDYRKGTGSRLSIGSRLSRSELLLLALMASENRAASALGNSYPGGHAAFVQAMNRKAQELGMVNTYFEEGTGLSSNNVSTPSDLVKLVNAASKNRWIRYYSTIPEYSVYAGGRYLDYRSTNRLVHEGGWDIGVQKTGYISEAGRCLVLEAKVNNRPTVMVFLDSVGGKGQRFQDAKRVRDWLEVGSSTARVNTYNNNVDYGVDEDAY